MNGAYLKKICGAIVILLGLFLQANAQNGSISGRISDENGDPLGGATVKLEETSIGTLTDDEGLFSLKNIEPGTYQVSVVMLDYETITSEVTVEAGQTAKFDRKLFPAGSDLDDVVIVGYGTQRKREITGSIARIDGKEVGDIIGTSFDATLQGKASGVQVLQGSGYAGAGARIRIRGTSTITAGGEPLYVVDGIPITADPFITGENGAQNYNPLASINPNDIESIEVLKDAAAAAIYGSRGANGVILITTKRGKKGRPTVTFTSRTGLSRPTRLLEFLNTEEWVQMYLEAWQNDGNPGMPTSLPGDVTVEEALARGTTDWYQYTVQTGFKQEYNLGFRGGSDKFNYYAGLSYLNTESFLVGNSYERYSGRLNFDYQPIKKLKVSGSSMLSRGRNNRVNQGWAGGFGRVQERALPYYDADSVYSNFGYWDNPNLITDLLDWRTIEIRTINTANLEFKPTKDLVFNATGSLDYMNLGDYKLEDSLLTGNFIIGKNSHTNIMNWNGTVTGNYNLSFLPEQHKVSILVGTEAQQSKTESGYLEIIDVNRQLYLDPEVGDDADTTETTNPTSMFTFASFFGRVNYTLKDKYLMKFSMRMDGSSKFGPDRKWGYFPAVGLGYIISEEDWFKNNVVNFLKLKASYGLTGNANIPFDAQFQTWALPTNSVNYNGSGTIYPNQLGNPDLGWETSQTFDVGFELGFLRDRITTEFSFYNQKTVDLLLNVALQASATGLLTRWDNVGSMRNRGVEFQITSRNLVGKFKWRTDFNIAHNKNQVLDIGTMPPDAIAGSGDTRVLPGYPVGVNYLVRFSHVDPATGRPVYLDIDGNETFEFKESNRVPVGNVNPDFVGGITNTFEYKNFDLRCLFTFSIGGNIYDDAAKRQLGVVTDWNMRREILDRWRKPGDVATYPALTLNSANYDLGSEWEYNSTLWLYDASFLRLKNLSLGYNFPVKEWTSGKVNRLRAFVQGTNLLTFTNYPGADPEVVRDLKNPVDRNLSPNITYLSPPQEKTLTLGIDLEF